MLQRYAENGHPNLVVIFVLRALNILLPGRQRDAKNEEMNIHLT
jgi:hypothetical protein